LAVDIFEGSVRKGWASAREKVRAGFRPFSSRLPADSASSGVRLLAVRLLPLVRVRVGVGLVVLFVLGR
jgi:hypothetical protein